MEGLEDMAGHNFFLSGQVWCRDQRTWSMRRQGRVMRSRTDYILGSDHRIFQNVDVQDSRHNSDHYMAVGSLHVSSPWNTLITLGAGHAYPCVLLDVR